MLAEGIPYADVRTGLAAWHQRGLNPAVLASVVHEIRTAPARQAGGRSTTDERVATARSLRSKYEALDQAEAAGLATVTHLAIGGNPA